MTETIITMSNNLERIRQLEKKGFCPIAIDGHTLKPGNVGSRDGIALSSYRDHYGDPAKIVIVGPVDAAVCFGLASRMKEVPHPLRKKELASAFSRLQMPKTWDFSLLAESIDAYCCNLNSPNQREIDISRLPYGELLREWNRRVSIASDILGVYTGIGAWRDICCRHTVMLDEISEDEYDDSEELNNSGRAEYSEEPRVLLVRDGVTRSLDRWYRKAPVVIVQWRRSKMVKLACRNVPVATRFLGHGGLTKVFPVLNEKLPGRPAMPNEKFPVRIEDQWGGRISVGGGPCVRKFSVEELRVVARIVLSFMNNRLGESSADDSSELRGREGGIAV